MGNTDGMPQPGFNEWISFKGQGIYWNPTFNINGKVKKQQGYITDLLTNSALGWLDTISRKKPFFLYLSHKAVHAMFQPAKEYDGKYNKMPIISPPSMYLTATDSSKYFGVQSAPQSPVNYANIPFWVRRQRYSWHGVDHMYDGDMQFDTFYRKYCETLLSVDQSIGNGLKSIIWIRIHW